MAQESSPKRQPWERDERPQSPGTGRKTPNLESAAKTKRFPLQMFFRSTPMLFAKRIEWGTARLLARRIPETQAR